jgi:hypothetical protein
MTNAVVTGRSLLRILVLPAAEGGTAVRGRLRAMSSPLAADAAHAESMPCPGCGYDRRGSESGVCPECGSAAPPLCAAITIPWERRRHVGRVRAFLQTVWMATFRPRRLAAAMGGPVDYRSAERFRWVVVGIVSLLLILVFVLLAWINRGIAELGGWSDLAWPLLDPKKPVTIGWEFHTMWLAGAMLIPVLPVGIVVALLIATAVPGYWFHPRRLPLAQQNRAVAISRYGAAPLVWLWLPGIALIAAAYYRDMATLTLIFYWTWDFFNPATWGCYVCAAVILLACFGNAIVLLARTTHCGVGHLIGAAISTVLGVAAGAVVGLILLPAVVGFLWIVADSLISARH